MLILPCFLVGGIPIFGVVKPPILRFLNHLYSPVFGEVPISCPHCITIFGDEILWNPHFLLPGQHLEGDAKQPPTAISCVRLSLAKLCYTKGAKVTIVARTKKKLETLGRWREWTLKMQSGHFQMVMFRSLGQPGMGCWGDDEKRHLQSRKTYFFRVCFWSSLKRPDKVGA